MPLRYATRARRANEGVKLAREGDTAATIRNHNPWPAVTKTVGSSECDATDTITSRTGVAICNGDALHCHLPRVSITPVTVGPQSRRKRARSAPGEQAGQRS